MADEPGYYRGIGWYQKELFIPEGWQEKQVYIHFEGASQVTELFVNGKSAGSHVGAYTAFNFNISGFIHQGINAIRVKVDNSFNPDIIPVSGDFSVYGGIYRSVYLVVLGQDHFDMNNYASNGVFISTPHVSAEAATVRVKGRVSTKQKLKVLTTIYDKGGDKIAESTVSPDGDGSFSTDVTIKSPHLWAPDHPYLYRVVNALVGAKDGTLLDEVINPLGFRWYSFDPERGFILNGEPLKLIGANRHQDFRGLGSALPDILHVNDVQLLKDMGGNFLRVSHYPQAPALMEACDRLGILVSVETPGNNKITESEEFARVTLEMQREMIRQNYNHPSVIIWSYMNEVLLGLPSYRSDAPKLEHYLEKVRNLATEIETLCREEDPERYTMIAFHGDLDLYKRAGLIDVPQVVGWNLYQGWYDGEFEDFEKFLLRFKEEYPNRPMIVSEYGADSDYRLHILAPARFDKT
ncbi:hypothetical protein AXK11_05935 [Cephaloticoccus primus]|uniref:Beta-galactosidase n=2 Tax=Cephaloticoccus primus TaxID=1548207 RepID=A0A139SLV6_9BACT|nr:hypothetical protein AXK11_05935 [Cephaloticoccus primus]